MVEKIIINPNKVRGYGNIMSPHSSSDYDVVNASLESGTDTVNGQSMTVYELEYAPNLTNTVLSLSVSPSSVYVYDNVVFTAVLEDEDDNPISGATVTFKEGDTVLGTDTTDNTGEASLTLSTLTAGSHSVTANYGGDSTYAGSNSSSVSVTVSHSYSLSFSSSSYVATGGSATLSLTLTDNSVAVSGATVTVTGSDSSLYTGITDSSGVATVTVSVSAETTFTATYSNVSDTCTVTVQTYLFYDDCTSSSGLSNYGSSISIWKTNTATANISYDSTENAYLLKGSGNYNAIIPITAVSNLDNYVMTFKAKHKVNSAYSQPSYFNYDTNTPTQPTCFGVRYLGDGRIMCDTFTSSNDTSINTVSGKTSGIASEYFTYKITKQGTSLHFEIERANSTNIYNKTMSVGQNYKGIAFGLATESGEPNSSYYIKEIKIEAL